MDGSRPLAGYRSFALCDTNRVADSAFAEFPLSLPGNFEVRNCWLVLDWERGLDDFWDSLRGVGEEGKGCEPDVMAFWCSCCEFERSSWS